MDQNHLPITNINCRERSNLLNNYEEWIINKAPDDLKMSFKTCLKFLTSELQTNVAEHARIDNYWILAQYWAGKKGICEICIADTGVGYRNSYRRTKYEVPDDLSAIENALNGLSSKEDGRGAGIPGIVNMFVNGYNGKLAIMSGNSMIYLKRGYKKIFDAPVSWKGAFVCLNFRLKDIVPSEYY